MRRTDWLVVLLVLLAMYSALVAYDLWAAQGVTPPAAVTSIDSFFEQQPGSHEGVVREHEGGEHLVVFRPLVGFVPSGPSAYVFDKSGRLVDWTVDSGDNARFQQKWHPAGARFDVDREFARAWVESR